MEQFSQTLPTYRKTLLIYKIHVNTHKKLSIFYKQRSSSPQLENDYFISSLDPNPSSRPATHARSST